METLGTDFNSTGSVLSRSQLEELRRRRGECLTCGRKCFQKRLFKLIPLTEEGLVLEGRCLNCRPLAASQFGAASPVPSLQGSHRTSSEDRERFLRTQSTLSNRSGSSPNPSGRNQIARTISDLSRSENSTGPSLSPRQQFRRVASAMPNTASKVPARMASLPLALTTTDETTEQITPLPPIETQPPPESAHQLQSSVPVVDASVIATREPSDKQLSIENTGTRSNSKTLFKSLSTKIAGSSRRSGEGGNFRSTQRKSLSAQLPTKEEVEQAHLTILAAQQHGIFGSSSNSAKLVDLPDDMDAAVSNFDQIIQQAGSQSSSRDVASPVTIPQVIPNEIDGYPVPQHGVLNRGGMVATVPITYATGSGQPHSSNHSFVSGSSIDDAKHSNSFRQVDTIAQSPDTNHIPHLAESVVYDHSPLPMTKLTEEEALDCLGRAGQNIDQVLQIMRDHSTSVLVATTALERLAAWKLSPDDQNRLGNFQAHMVIADIMHLHQNTHSVYVKAFGALWNMSGTTQNQVAIASSRALDLMLTAMDQFADNAEIQETAMAILSNLGAAPENLDVLSQKGALNKVVDTMTKFSEVSSIQVKGCGAMSNLAAHDGTVKQRLMECGAGGAVVVAMVMHPNDTYLVEKALRALRNLCANSDENKIEMANIGGVDSVITAMQVHRDVLGVQKEGAWTLSNLATNHDNRDVIGECGGIDVVIRAIWVHSNDVELLEWCCRALFTLTLAEQNCEIVLEVGGISAIVNTMQGHVDSAIVQEMGCAVLGNLAGNDRSRARIVEEEALDAIVLAMVLHTNESQVQERACTVLSRLAVPANHYAMIAANIPELVRQAASNFPDRCNEPATQVLNILSEAY